MQSAVGETEFAEFTRARWGPLVRFAYGLTLDVGRAEDLTQEALVRFWRMRGRVAVERPEAYVRRTLVNLAVTAGRRRWWSERVLGRVPGHDRRPRHGPEPHSRRPVRNAVLGSGPSGCALVVAAPFEYGPLNGTGDMPYIARRASSCGGRGGRGGSDRPHPHRRRRFGGSRSTDGCSRRCPAG
ncbi:sigma-70-like protein [Streptomyces sp. CG 926]|uniref:sigma factor n=1 Tax=Streptomyces sp. CG 926 TaxID=1882405 RepID=UPI000D6B9C60|nr:sigma factor [Streptomyces sp. CG 926]PWK71061.1 sigma-70-like protein [Streptomyces sp. CG 926]